MHTSSAHHVFRFSTASSQLLLLLLVFCDPVILRSDGQPAVVSQTCQFIMLHQADVAAMMYCRMHHLQKILPKYYKVVTTSRPCTMYIQAAGLLDMFCPQQGADYAGSIHMYHWRCCACIWGGIINSHTAK